MILRRTDDGAAKCALRDLRREEETSEHVVSTNGLAKAYHIHDGSDPSSLVHPFNDHNPPPQHNVGVPSCKENALTGVELHLEGLEVVDGDDGRFWSSR